MPNQECKHAKLQKGLDNCKVEKGKDAKIETKNLLDSDDSRRKTRQQHTVNESKGNDSTIKSG